MSPTPDQFAQFLADIVTKQVVKEVRGIVSETVRAALREPAPPKLYEVVKQTPSGPVTHQLSLSQSLADLTDQVRIGSEICRHQTQAVLGLIQELNEHKKIGERITKANKKKLKTLEDEDEET